MGLPEGRHALPLPATVNRVSPAEKKAFGTEGHHNLEYAQSLERRRQRRAMIMTSRMIIGVLFLALLVCGFGSASPGPAWQRGLRHNQKALDDNKISGSDASPFSALLGSASSEDLHDLLRKYFPERFKPGVWPSEKDAMEAVHRANAPLATSMVQMAKRDTSNSTTSSGPTSSGPGGGSTTSTQDNPTSTGNPPDSSTTPTQGPTSSDSTPTSTTDSPSTGSSTAGMSTGTSGGSFPSTSSSDGSLPSSVVSGAVTSSTPSQGGSTMTTSKATTSKTSTSAHSLKPVTSTFTSTMSNGQIVVVTQTSTIDGTAETASAGTSSAVGSLQTNAASLPRARGFMLEAVIGAAVGGALLV